MGNISRLRFSKYVKNTPSYSDGEGKLTGIVFPTRHQLTLRTTPLPLDSRANLPALEGDIAQGKQQDGGRDHAGQVRPDDEQALSHRQGGA